MDKLEFYNRFAYIKDKNMIEELWGYHDKNPDKYSFNYCAQTLNVYNYLYRKLKRIKIEYMTKDIFDRLLLGCGNLKHIEFVLNTTCLFVNKRYCGIASFHSLQSFHVASKTGTRFYVLKDI